MRKLYFGIMATTIFLLCNAPVNIFAQKASANESASNVRTKVVRDCEYDVLPGLAEIVSIEMIRPAGESTLNYDEHEVLFRFTPMEGGEMLEMLRDADIEFVLRSRAVRIPVGPEYIKAKRLRKGTKYAMNLLQTNSRDACLERYTYESKALDNDLFEAYEHIIEFTKEAYIRKLEAEERAHERRKAADADTEATETVDPTIETDTGEEVATEVDEFDYGDLTEEEIANLTEAEMIALVEDNLKKKNNSNTASTAEELGIDEAAIRAEIEAQLRKEHADELKRRKNNNKNSTDSSNPESNDQNSTDPEKDEKRKAKEAAKKEKAEKKRKEQLEIDRKNKEAELRANLKKEIEEKIQKEIADNTAADKAANELEEKKAIERKHNKEIALEKLKAIEQELTQLMIDENKRKDCVFGNRMSGTIEVIKVSKVKEANVSHLKHVEYEVLVMFRPDNFGDLSKKEKKYWESHFLFTLDPKGVNANPGAGYIRKYKVFKASKYQGFAQQLESGICNPLTLFSPDLPNDASKIKLK